VWRDASSLPWGLGFLGFFGLQSRPRQGCGSGMVFSGTGGPPLIYIGSLCLPDQMQFLRAPPFGPLRPEFFVDDEKTCSCFGRCFSPRRNSSPLFSPAALVSDCGRFENVIRHGPFPPLMIGAPSSPLAQSLFPACSFLLMGWFLSG